MQVQQEELAVSNQVLGRTHDALADVLAGQGDMHAAVGHARTAVEVVAGRLWRGLICCGIPAAEAE